MEKIDFTKEELKYIFERSWYKGNEKISKVEETFHKWTDKLESEIFAINLDKTLDLYEKIIVKDTPEALLLSSSIKKRIEIKSLDYNEKIKELKLRLKILTWLCAAENKDMKVQSYYDLCYDYQKYLKNEIEKEQKGEK